ncbi:MFS transporter [Pseudomonas sp. dw_358]|uniref:MFS transporter n=1 Tax=Pseudomonas sp. dw_358 TaxID=2720083 RepID=UPI001BD5D337|nr:MFS transporter [Pseudomonas sp. dw_358]
MELFADRPDDDGLPGAERRLAMIAVMTATAMSVLDGTIINVALPSIARALHSPAAATIWVVNGFLLAAAMTLVAFAALASRVGFRVQYTAGLAVFTLASLGCALSSSLGVLTLMRALQGVGAAAILSIGPAVYRLVFPTRLLGRILGLNALLVALSTAVGPTVGGLLLTALSWEWLFAINVPLGLLSLVLAWRAIPQKPVRTGEPFDIPGAVLSAVAMGALILATDACADLSTISARLSAAGYGLLALAAAAAFIWRQGNARQPLLPLDLFASRRFSLAALTSLASFVGQGIAVICLPFLFQNAYGYSVFAAAMLFTAWPIGIVLAAPQAGKLADRYPPAMLSTAGLVLLTLGLAALALLPAQPPMWDIAWRELLCGVGFGLFQSPNNRELLGNVSRERSGNASGVLAVVRTFGQCFGAALVGIILSWFATGAATSLTAAQDAQAMHLTLWVAACATLLAVVMSVNRIQRAAVTA